MTACKPHHAVPIIALLCMLVHTARAETDGERAARLFAEGRQLAQLAKYREACDRFAQSFELDAAAGTQVNFADCQEHLGNLARAFELFERVSVDEQKTNPVRAQYARDRAKALLPRLATLVVHSGHAPISVTIGGRSVAPASEIHAYVEPGDVEVVVSSPENFFKTTAHTKAGSETTIDVPRAQSDGSTHRRRSWVIGGAVAGGLGVTTIAISGVMALYAQRYYHDTFARGECVATPGGDQCTPAGLERVDAARHRANLATGVFVSGTMLVGAGVALYLFAPHERAIEIAPTASATEVGLAVAGRF